MSKLLKLKNKPFWTVVVVLFAFGFISNQMQKEGFEDANLKVVGQKVTVNLAKIPNDIFDSFFTANAANANRPGLRLLVDASDGKELWKLGDSAPTKTDAVKSYIWILNTDPVNKTLTQVTADEKEIKGRGPLDWQTTASYTIINIAIQNSDGKYVDKNGASLIGSTNVAGYNVSTIVLYVVAGIVGLLILWGLFAALTSKSSNANLNRTVNTSLPQQE